MMMDHKQQCSNQDYPPSLLSNNNTTAAAAAAASPSPRKPPVSGGGGNGGGGDRSKRDEWSEGAVSTLIDAYESKWVLRNRAKLKGQDWEDVARYVSCRANSSKSPKTQTQCKNKIESMKKRYRSESATSDGSSWPLFQRLDLLLRGSGPPPPPPPPPIVPQLPPPAPLPPTILGKAPAMVTDHPVVTQVVEPPVALQPQEESRPPTTVAAGQNSHGSGGGLDRGLNKVDEVAVTKVSDPCADDDDNNGSSSSSSSSDKNLAMETDSSTPAARYSDNKEKKLKQGGKRGRMRSPEKSSSRRKKKRRRGRAEEQVAVEIAESIRWLGEVVVRTEQARMDTMKDLEKMRAEAEAKRGEIDLKRTEIMANTQLEIARIFAAATGGGGGGKEGGGGNIDSSLRIGRS